MAETQFASLNGAAVYAANVDEEEFGFDFKPNANTLARRSISIFSRRGTETPEPKPPFIAQAAMAKTPKPKKEMNERQKSWLGRRKSVCGASSPVKPSKPKGTVLNAVPLAPTIKMTALEEEMATSPNEEILSAVDEQSPVQIAYTAHSQLGSTSPTSAGFWNMSSTSMAQRTRSEKRSEKNNRIGLWVNGVTQWDDQIQTRPHEHQRWVEEAIEQETGFTPLHDIPAAERPRLSVLIPNASEPRVNTTTLSTIVQPHARRPMVSVAPASIVSRFNINTPTITVEEPIDEHDVSPVESIQPTPPAVEQHESRSHLLVDSPASIRPKASRESSDSSFSSSLERETDAGSSSGSKRSSATSLEAIAPVLPERSKKRLSGRALTLAAPAATDSLGVNKPLPPNPIPLPHRTAPTAPLARRSSVRPKSSSSVRSAPTGRSSMLQPNRPNLAKTRSLTHLDLLDAEFMKSSPYVEFSATQEEISRSESDELHTPTLSQAENELHAQLADIADDVLLYEVVHKTNMVKSASIRRSDSVRSVMHPPERAPTVPRRSRKRDWRASKAKHIVQQAALARRKSDSTLQVSTDHAGDESLLAPNVHRSVSASQARLAYAFGHHLVPQSEETTLASTSAAPRIIIDDGLIVIQGPVIVDVSGEEHKALATASAEDVLLNILSALTSTEDLYNTALINKGMYRVYKENEMQLIKTVTFNQSPAAWEFREWCPPDRLLSDTSSKASSQLEHNPLSYMRCSRRDATVIEALKVLVLQHCQTFIRRETAFAFTTPMHPNAQRFNDAFWRIWCFCKIFGCGKGREDDITGQLDWLKGGLLANNQACVATVNTNLDFDMGSVLLNAPDHFAKGNDGGLTAQQLYDMTELWTCLFALLHGYQGRVDQARASGVFDGCPDVEEGDIEQEEQILEEWICHLLTLGPSVVLEMTEHANDRSAAGFSLAQLNGWTRWTPPTYSASRSTFLKEPVARLYEERVAAAASAFQNPQEREKKENSRKRVASLAKEIRLQRQTSSYRRSPYIDMNSERPMSVLSRRNSTMSARSANGIVSPITTSRYNSPIAMSPSARNFSKPQPNSPPGHARKISPIIEERVDSFNRLSLQNLGGIAEDTGDRAVRKIVEMGFTVGQAREALRMTDMGDGLRVDRAVDLLLRQRS